MSYAIRLSLVAACVALSACGTGAKLAATKQGAAEAAFMASKGANGASGGILALARQNANANVDVTVNCDKAGQAALHYIIDTSGTSTALTFTVTYTGCSYNGTTKLDGQLTMDLSASTTATSASVDLTMDGKVTFSGDIQDFVTVGHLTETVQAGTLASGSGATVNVQLNGTITTSSGTYSYTNESISITADHLDTDTSSSSGNKS